MICSSRGAGRCVGWALAVLLLSGGTAHGQDYQQLARDAVVLGLKANGLLDAPPAGPVWLDLERSGSFLKEFGLSLPDIGVLFAERYLGHRVIPVLNRDAALQEGRQDDPRLLALHAAAKERGATVPAVPPGDSLLLTRWVRDDGVTLELRLMETLRPGHYRIEVGLRRTAFFFLPVGTSVGIEAEWTGSGWRLTELYRKEA